MRYQKLAELYEELSGTTKRLKKIEILSKFLKALPEHDKDIMYLLLGDISPEYNKEKIGISNQITINGSGVGIYAVPGSRTMGTVHSEWTIGGSATTGNTIDVGFCLVLSASLAFFSSALSSI